MLLQVERNLASGAKDLFMPHQLVAERVSALVLLLQLQSWALKRHLKSWQWGRAHSHRKSYSYECNTVTEVVPIAICAGAFKSCTTC